MLIDVTGIFDDKAGTRDEGRGTSKKKSLLGLTIGSRGQRPRELKLCDDRTEGANLNNRGWKPTEGKPH
jgi:hypothetical protein